MELDYQGDFQASLSASNPATILQSDLLGSALIRVQYSVMLSPLQTVLEKKAATEWELEVLLDHLHALLLPSP